jgi:hypothetical protein
LTKEIFAVIAGLVGFLVLANTKGGSENHFIP